ncbi:hypothetical protein PFISCL1PPCAC_13846, partial [Pristionchus fissidentatus]
MPIFVCHGCLCRWHAPERLLMFFTVLISTCGSTALSTVVFMRLRNILPFESSFRLTRRQSVILMGLSGTVFVLNTVGFYIASRDDARKHAILNRTEFMFLRDKSGAVFWGEMFETPSLDTELYYLAFTAIYATALFNGILVYSTFALRREKSKLLNVTTRKRSSDQGNRMLQIQLWGATITFIIPVISTRTVISEYELEIAIIEFQLIRFINMVFYVNNSMVAIAIHLLLNRTYQRWML